MPTIVDFPTVVKEAVAVFGEVFDADAARYYCAESLTGRIVADRKTVYSINREVACTTDQRSPYAQELPAAACSYCGAAQRPAATRGNPGAIARPLALRLVRAGCLDPNQ
jgi:hypothetical protein